jgi:hypothetical protein
MPLLATFYPILRFLVFRPSTRNENGFHGADDVRRGLSRLGFHSLNPLGGDLQSTFSLFILFVGLDRLLGIEGNYEF